MRRPDGYKAPHPLDPGPDDMLGFCREVAIGILYALPVMFALACLCHWIDPETWARVMEGFR